MEYSSHYASEGATGEGSARIQHQFKVDPNKVRALPPGSASVISRGRAMKVQVIRAPDLCAARPEPAHHQPTAPAGNAASTRLSALPF